MTMEEEFMEDRHPGNAELTRRLDAFADVRLRPDVEAMVRVRENVMREAVVRLGGSNGGGHHGTNPLGAPFSVIAGGQAETAPAVVLPRRGRRLLVALLAAALGLLVMSGVAFAGSRAGGPLYDTRVWLETVTLPSEPSARIDAQIARLQARLDEAAEGATQGNGPGCPGGPRCLQPHRRRGDGHHRWRSDPCRPARACARPPPSRAHGPCGTPAGGGTGSDDAGPRAQQRRHQHAEGPQGRHARAAHGQGPGHDATGDAAVHRPGHDATGGTAVHRPCKHPCTAQPFAEAVANVSRPSWSPRCGRRHVAVLRRPSRRRNRPTRSTSRPTDRSLVVRKPVGLAGDARRGPNRTDRARCGSRIHGPAGLPRRGVSAHRWTIRGCCSTSAKGPFRLLRRPWHRPASRPS